LCCFDGFGIYRAALYMDGAVGRGSPNNGKPRHEVDFVVRLGRSIVAIEVKSRRARDTHPGLAAFAVAFKPTRQLLVGAGGIAIEDFLLEPVAHWLER
jgi:hypothetical protein